MDEYYPTPEEEFEMMHAAEMELLDEMEYDDHFEHMSVKPPDAKSNSNQPPESGQTTSIPPPSVKSASVRRSLNFTSRTQHLDSPASDSLSPPHSPINAQILKDATSSTSVNGSIKKRSFDEIFGDIDDIVVEEALEEYRKTKGHKRPRKEDDIGLFSFLNETDTSTTCHSETELIDRILTMRKRAHIESNQDLQSSAQNSSKVSLNSTITKGVPKWPFVSVTSELGARIYVRVRTEEYFNDVCKSVSHQKKTTGLLRAPFATLKSSAMDYLCKRQESETADPNNVISSSNVGDVNGGNDLWVHKYRPSCYTELLSDESTNRTLLHWLKLWDKVVFNKERKTKIKHKTMKEDQKSEYHFKRKPFGNTLNEELDEYGRPHNKMVLLCGPPGLGKTTLAHMVANSAGYNVVEVNASDDRSPEAFRTQLEAATQMKAVMGPDPRPNCLVLDEIDGAPAASVETLLKFVLGKDVGKSKGKKKDTNHGILKRPVICVCNDAYVPALRPLRQHAFVLHFPPTASERLATRLLSIARKQKMKTDMSAMLALCEKTQNDIRSCLSTLNYFKSQGSHIQLSDIKKSDVGVKDVQRGLFSVWQEIFQIQRNKGSFTSSVPVNEISSVTSDLKVAESPLALRIQNILNIVQNYGDYERLALGVFENYPNMKLRDSSLCGLVKGLELFCTNDLLNSEIHSTQNYILMPYLPYAFAVWHLLYADLGWPKINYPSSSHEAFVKETHIRQIVTEVMKGMSPSVRAGYNVHKLIVNVLPILLDIIVPNFRPVSLQLFSSHEKQELCNLVNIMIDYNLTYTQERTQEGTYVCTLDPKIEEVVLFEGYKVSRVLTYSVKQLVAREIELEKMRRHEQLICDLDRRVNGAAIANTNCNAKHDKSVKEKPSDKGATISPPTVPNHLRKLKPKVVLKEVQSKDFFGRIISLPVSSTTGNGNSVDDNKGDIWFHFKEGFNNAVRKTVRMSDLM